MNVYSGIKITNNKIADLIPYFLFTQAVPAATNAATNSDTTTDSISVTPHPHRHHADYARF